MAMENKVSDVSARIARTVTMDSGLLVELVIWPRDFARARWLGPGMTKP